MYAPHYSLQPKCDPTVSSHSFLSLSFSILREMLGVNNGIDVPYQHITNSIFRLQCKNWFSNLEEPQVSGEGERGPHLLIDIHEIH